MNGNEEEQFLSELEEKFGIVANEIVLDIKYFHGGQRMKTTVDYDPTRKKYITTTVKFDDDGNAELA